MRQARSCELGVDGRLWGPGRRASRHGALSSWCLFAILLRIGWAVVVSIAGAFVFVLGAGPAHRPFTWSGISTQHRPCLWRGAPEQRVFFFLHVKHAELMRRRFA